MKTYVRRWWVANAGLLLMLFTLSCGKHTRPNPIVFEQHTAENAQLQRAATLKFVVTCGDKRWHGTGTAVGPKNVLTARHVVDCDAAKLKIKVVSVSKHHTYAHILWKSEIGDVAMVRLDKAIVPHTGYVRAPAVIDSEVCYSTATPLRFRVCGKVQMQLEPGRFLVNLPVWAGNSGSTVFDARGRIVGVVTHGLGRYAFTTMSPIVLFDTRW